MGGSETGEVVDADVLGIMMVIRDGVGEQNLVAFIVRLFDQQGDHLQGLVGGHFAGDAPGEGRGRRRWR